MTREIKANNAFQANAESIGLQTTVGAELHISVDGVTWVKKADIEDEVNVICNIPYHLYLKCSADSVITEV